MKAPMLYYNDQIYYEVGTPLEAKTSFIYLLLG